MLACTWLQYLETKERAGETIVADCVRGAAEYVTKIFKVEDKEA